MNSWGKMAAILTVAIMVGSGVSHGLIHWLGIRSSQGSLRHYGSEQVKAETILHGSSIAWDGIDWLQVSEHLGGAIESWITPGSSPAEWEIQHEKSPQIKRTIVVFSAYDLNEYWLCDYRADIVTFSQTLSDLGDCGDDKQLCKRILSQYPQTLVRTVFPTVGRSDGVMVGIRAKLQEMISGDSAKANIDAPQIRDVGKSEVTERLSDWDAGRLQRRLTLMRTGFQGKHGFAGLKHLALKRLLHRSWEQGPVVLIVMPVSPVYRKEFLDKATTDALEYAITDLIQANPKIKVLRMDKLVKLNDINMYSDLVHLNMYGQEIATAELLGKLGM